MIFKKNLEKVRKIKKLSQSELAKLSGLQPSSISHYESGRREPSLKNIIKLCNALQCSSDLLLGIIPDNFSDLKDKYIDSKFKLQDIRKILNRH